MNNQEMKALRKSCPPAFAEDQTDDEQLIAAVNSVFGTELKAEDYRKILILIKKP